MVNYIAIDRAATILKLLGDETRLSMIGLLNNNDCCVCEFVAIFNMSQPAISQHLRKLKDVGIVYETRKGQWVVYSLNREHVCFSLIEDILTYIPNQQEKLIWLEKQGKRVSCD